MTPYFPIKEIYKNKTEMPFFSIILPTYNRASFLNRSIGSVLNQNFTDFELIIIDDASTDNTKEVVTAFNDNRIRYIKNETNIERSASRNKGIELSAGTYICFLDSDDAFRPNHLICFYDFIERENETKCLIYSGIQRNYANGEIETVLEYPKSNENVIEWIIEKQLPPPSSVCIHKEILLQYKFNPHFVLNEDIELWVRITTSYPLYHISAFTLDFYIHGGNTKFLLHNQSTELINVFKAICRNPICKNHISKNFKRNRLKQLRSQGISTAINSNNSKNIVLLILDFILRYPFAYQNKYRLYVLLINIPLLKSAVKHYSVLKNK